MNLLNKDFEDCPLIFSVDPNCLPAMETLKAISARLWYEEYAMGLDLGSVSLPPDQSPAFTLSFETEEPSLIAVTARLQSSRRPAGSCRLFLEGSSACLFSFEIRPSLRGRGLGYAFLCQLISRLKAMDIAVLNLQVSGQNLPAFNLYKKTGFRIRDTLSYYLYESGEVPLPDR